VGGKVTVNPLLELYEKEKKAPAPPPASGNTSKVQEAASRVNPLLQRLAAETGEDKLRSNPLLKLWSEERASAKLPPANRSAVVEAARSFRGTPYVFGGTTPGKGADCSALSQCVWKALGVSIPRTAAGQYKAGKPVAPDALQPGDLVFFRDTGGRKGITHVGVYLGGGRIAEMSSGSTKGYVETDLDTPYHQQHLAGFRTFRHKLPPVASAAAMPRPASSGPQQKRSEFVANYKGPRLSQKAVDEILVWRVNAPPTAGLEELVEDVKRSHPGWNLEAVRYAWETMRFDPGKVEAARKPKGKVPLLEALRQREAGKVRFVAETAGLAMLAPGAAVQEPVRMTARDRAEVQEAQRAMNEAAARAAAGLALAAAGAGAAAAPAAALRQAAAAAGTAALSRLAGKVAQKQAESLQTNWKPPKEAPEGFLAQQAQARYKGYLERERARLLAEGDAEGAAKIGQMIGEIPDTPAAKALNRYSPFSKKWWTTAVKHFGSGFMYNLTENMARQWPEMAGVFASLAAGGLARAATKKALGPLAAAAVVKDAVRGTAAGGVLGEYQVESSGSLAELLAREGVDLTDPESIRGAMNDSARWARIKAAAKRRGIAATAIDQLAELASAGLIGSNVAGRGLAGAAARTAAGAAAQMGGESASELAAKLTEGRRLDASDWSDVALEGIYGLGQAGVTAAGQQIASGTARAGQQAAQEAVGRNRVIPRAEIPAPQGNVEQTPSGRYRVVFGEEVKGPVAATPEAAIASARRSKAIRTARLVEAFKNARGLDHLQVVPNRGGGVTITTPGGARASAFILTPKEMQVEAARYAEESGASAAIHGGGATTPAAFTEFTPDGGVRLFLSEDFDLGELNHEVVHWLERAGILKPEEVAQLAEYGRRKYGRTRGLEGDISQSEAAAYAIQMASREAAAPFTVERLVSRVADAMRSLTSRQFRAGARLVEEFTAGRVASRPYDVQQTGEAIQSETTRRQAQGASPDEALPDVAPQPPADTAAQPPGEGFVQEPPAPEQKRRRRAQFAVRAEVVEPGALDERVPRDLKETAIKRDLVALRNVMAGTLATALWFDGQMPAPSIAVLPVETDYRSFGENTLVGSPGLGLPEKTPVYDRDAWTAMPPAPEMGDPNPEKLARVVQDSPLPESDKPEVEEALRDALSRDLAVFAWKALSDDGLGAYLQRWYNLERGAGDGLVPDGKARDYIYWLRWLVDEVGSTPALYDTTTGEETVYSPERAAEVAAREGSIDADTPAWDSEVASARRAVRFLTREDMERSRWRFAPYNRFDEALSLLDADFQNEAEALIRSGAVKTRAESFVEAVLREVVSQRDVNPDNYSERVEQAARRIAANRGHRLTGRFLTPGMEGAVWNSIATLIPRMDILPTQYFEAKPQRVVRLEEFPAAVISSRYPRLLRSALKQHIPDVREYSSLEHSERPSERVQMAQEAARDHAVLFARRGALEGQRPEEIRAAVAAAPAGDEPTRLYASRAQHEFSSAQVAEGGTYIGSINVAYWDPNAFHDPADVRRALQQITDENLELIQRQRRGVRPNEVTEQAARLKAAGLTPDKLKQFFPGKAGNAETILAVDMVFMALADQVQKAKWTYAQKRDEESRLNLMRAIEDWRLAIAVANGLKAEAGRALQACKILRRVYDLPEEQRRAKIEDIIYKIDRDFAPVTPEELEMLSNTPDTDTEGVYRLLINMMNRRMKKGHRLHLWMYANMLSSMTAQAANVYANAFLLGLEENVVRPLAAGIDRVRSALTGTPRSVYYTPALAARANRAAMVETMRIWADALKAARYVAKHGFTREAAERLDMPEGGREFADITIRGKQYTHPMNYPLRLLASEDAFFRSLASQLRLNELLTTRAINELKKTTARPSEDQIVEKVMDYKRNLDKHMDLVYQAERYGEQILMTKKSDLLRKINAIVTHEVEWLGGIQPGRLLAPFTTVPLNLAATGLDYTPLGAAKRIITGKDVWGQESPLHEAMRGLARSIVGSTAFMAMYAFAKSNPDDVEAEREDKEGLRKLKQQEGFRPFSIRVGDRWYSAEVFGPLAPIVYAAIAVAKKRPEELVVTSYGPLPQTDSAVVRGAQGYAKGLLDQPFLQGMDALTQILSETEEGRVGAAMERVASNIAGALVPYSGLQRNIANATDTVRRGERAGPEDPFALRVGRRVASGIPGLRKVLEPDIGPLGKPLPQLPSGWAAFARIAGWPTPQKDPAAQELIRLRVSPPVYSGRYVVDGVVHTVSPEEFRQKKKELGDATRTALEKLFASDGYRRMNDEEKAAEAARVIAAVRRAVLGQPSRSRGPRPPRKARQARR